MSHREEIKKWITPFFITTKRCLKEYTILHIIEDRYECETSHKNIVTALSFHMYTNDLYKHMKKEVQLSPYMYEVIIDEKTRKTVIFPIVQEVCIDEDMYLYVKQYTTQKQEEDSKGNKQMKSVVQYTLQLYCKNHYLHHIHSLLNKYIENYKKHQENVKQRYVYEATREGADLLNIFSRCNMSSTKTFENLFFESKKDLINKLDDFTGQHSEYIRLGIPYTLGFLFHGEPGTGKTSCIKAIASYLHRNIIIVNMRTITTNKMFTKLFSNNATYNYNKESIFVFEEIDCISIDTKNPFLDRSLKDEKENELTNLAHILKQDDKLIQKDNDNLTLSTILETLDGIVENSHRICIFTTNYPERIDKALLRPGRIDMCIEFKRLRKSDVQEMYTLWFSTPIPNEVYLKMTDYKFTQAEIGNLFSKYRNRIETLHYKLVQ